MIDWLKKTLSPPRDIWEWVKVDISKDPRMEKLVCPKCSRVTNNPETRWIKAVDYMGYGGIPAHMEVLCSHCWYADKIYEWDRVKVYSAEQ